MKNVEYCFECDTCGAWRMTQEDALPDGWFELKGDGKTPVRYRPAGGRDFEEVVVPELHFCQDCYEAIFSTGWLWENMPKYPGSRYTYNEDGYAVKVGDLVGWDDVFEDDDLSDVIGLTD